MRYAHRHRPASQPFAPIPVDKPSFANHQGLLLSALASFLFGSIVLRQKQCAARFSAGNDDNDDFQRGGSMSRRRQNEVKEQKRARADQGKPIKAAKASSSAPRKVMLALQGGGAHSAYAWGVLEYLLDLHQNKEIEITAISGTSGGAINAVLVAQGLQDGAEHAKRILGKFWALNAVAGTFSPFSVPVPLFGSWNMDGYPWVIGLNILNLLQSPYQSLPGINPLSVVLSTCIDFERLNQAGGPPVYVVATNARTGHFKVFTKDVICAQHVLASACLPTLFRGVVLDGDLHWDGGYLKDPGISPLLHKAKKRPELLTQSDDDRERVADILVIGINPISRDSSFFPLTPWEIADRVNELSFNASLQAEAENIMSVNESLNANATEESDADGKGKRVPVFLHYLAPSEEIEKLGLSSKSNVSFPFVNFLRERGLQAAGQWWTDRCRSNLGIQHTDIDKILDYSHVERHAGSKDRSRKVPIEAVTKWKLDA